MKWFYGFYPTDRIKINNKYHYISDFFPQINILFSIWPIISSHQYFYRKIKIKSFRRVFSIPEKTEVIADSGSFSYYRLKNNFGIQWNLKSILKIYDAIKPNFAVHNDIPISFLKKIKDIDTKRILEKNLSNANCFLKSIQNKQYEPIGVAQGINEEDYINQILELYYLGYNYVGIGGIAYKGEKRIDSILTSIFQNIRIDKLKIKLHVFGVGRINILKKYKIYSFDNTSPLNDSHRDKIGKRTYYYLIDDKGKSFVKGSLFDLQKQNYRIKCNCPVCNILSEEILLTGSAYTNHSRAFHNAYIYNKCLL